MENKTSIRSALRRVRLALVKDAWNRCKERKRADDRDRKILKDAYLEGLPMPHDPDYSDIGQWVEDGFPEFT